MRLRQGSITALAALLLAMSASLPVAAQTSEPSLPAEVSQPAWVTGTLRLAASCVDAKVEAADGLMRERGWRCAPQEWVTTDPRLSGASTNTWNADAWVVDGALVSLRRATYEVVNDGGAWRCEAAPHLAHGSGLFFDPDHPESVTCVGSGGNLGLTAIVAIDWSDFEHVTISALIVPGDPPPLP